jgi:archaellum component FlaC
MSTPASELVDAKLEAVEARMDARVAGIESMLRAFIRQVDDRFARIDSALLVINQRFDRVDARFDAVDVKFERVNDRFDAVDAKFERVNDRFEAVDAKFERVNGRFDAIDAKFERVNARFDAVTAEIAGINVQIAGINERLSGMDLRISSVERSVRDTQASLSNLKIVIVVTGITAVLATVFGVAAFNAALLSNMNASYSSGKELAMEHAEVRRQADATAKLLQQLQVQADALKLPAAPARSPGR